MSGTAIVAERSAFARTISNRFEARTSHSGVNALAALFLIGMTVAALDPTFFRRELVANLVTNAVKYTLQAGKQIEVSWREGRPEANERGPVILVRDRCSGTC